jgi:signal transduction histidine kinase
MLEQIKALFAVNDVIVQFVHGQVFLVLGVAMALQWRQRSELELARALPWLAAVGILEAFATWGNSFIPIQAEIFSPELIQQLRLMQLVVYLAAFTALLGLGLRLNELAEPRRFTFFLPTGIFIVGALLLGAQQALLPAANAVSEALMRYVVCAPSALLVAYGLRRQARRLVGPFALGRIVNALRIAGFAFLLYAVAEGVLVPPLPVFPASVLNDQTIYNAVGVPIGIARAVAGGLIAFYLLLALDVFRIEAERVALELEREKSLGTERERISRDLHDGTIQSIYAAGLVLDGARHSVDAAAAASDPAGRKSDLDSAREQLEQAMAALNKTIQGIRGYIYDLRATAANEDLARGLVDIITEFRNRTGLQTRWQAEGIPAFTLSPQQRQQIYHIAREALSNVARHAGATQVFVELRYDGCGGGTRAICLRIGDNGTGQVPDQGQLGRGLRNMRERAALLGATLNIQGSAGTGTVVTLEISDVKNQITAGR